MLNAPEHLNCSKLTKVYLHRPNDLLAVNEVSFSVQQGQFVSIVGPSGCGKSTLLRVVGGLIPPTSGKVRIEGRSPKTAQQSQEIGFVFQDPSLLPWRSIISNLRLSLEISKCTDRQLQEPQALLSLVGLAGFDYYYPYQISGGMQQKVALARALMLNPSLLLMDEPFGALDELSRSALRYDLLRIWSVNQKTVLFVTHSLNESVALSDRVIILSSRPGRLLADIKIDLPRPRHEEMEHTPQFIEYVRHLRDTLREDDL